VKALRYNKVLGLAIGEHSLLVAEIHGGEHPEVRHTAEFVYPQGAGPDQPEAMGLALGKFLKDDGFTANVAIAGLPARWILVSSKEAPVTDELTRNDMLRLQAEVEFSSEITDLVYDFVDNRNPEVAQPILLVATARKYVTALEKACEVARIKLAAIMPSAVALGEATARTGRENAMVLAVAATGSELTAQRGVVPAAVRHLRYNAQQSSFLSELRRLVSTLPTTGTDRELVLWDGSGLDGPALSQQLGFPVRTGDIASLGVTASSNGNGQVNVNGYAAAIALALAGTGAVGPSGPPVDFLHSRLAPPKVVRIPRWTYSAAATVVVVIFAMVSLNQTQQADLAALQAQQHSLSLLDPQTMRAKADVKTITMARLWYNHDPRYLACLADLTKTVEAGVDDGLTYVTSIHLQEPPPPPTRAVKNAPPPLPARSLLIKLAGRTSDLQRAQQLVDALRKLPTVINLDFKSGNSTGGPGITAPADTTGAAATATGGFGRGGRGGGRGGGRRGGGVGAVPGVATVAGGRAEESQFDITYTFVPKSALSPATPARPAAPSNVTTGRRTSLGR
jgi:hypothetical protein